MLYPDFAPGVALEIWAREACAPLVVDGAELEAARSLLLERATALGHVMTDQPDLHVVARGRHIAPVMDGAAFRFDLPAGSTIVRLLSRHGVPAEMYDSNPDHRRLGVAVSALALDGEAMALDDPRLGTGWHAVEPGLRWTDGAAEIAVGAARQLRVGIRLAARSWLAPPQLAGTRQSGAG